MITSINGLGQIPAEISLLRLGFIGLGEKTEKAAKKTEHFVLPEELEAIFGNKCRQLPISLPFDEREMFCPQQWRREVKTQSNSRKAMCRGNGDGVGMQCVEKDGEWNWEDYNCEGHDCSHAKSKKCKRTADFRFYVIMNGLLSAGIYQITTHNANSMRNINAQSELFKQQFGRVDLLPLWLNLVPDEGRDGTGTLYKYYSLSLSLRMSEKEAFFASRNIPLVDTEKIADVENQEPNNCACKCGDTSPETDFNNATEIHKQIRTFAAKIKKLNSKYAEEWLKTMCGIFGAKEVEEITDPSQLKLFRDLLINKGKSLSEAKK
jgi:hypothetical protein